MNRGVVFALGLALVVAESGDGSGRAGAGPGVQVPAVAGAGAGCPRCPSCPFVPCASGGPGPHAVLHQLPAPVPVLPSAAPPAVEVGTSAQSVRRAVPLGSGGRSAPVSAAREGRAAGSSAAAARAGGACGQRCPAPGAACGWSARERRLRRSVSRLRACLDGLPTLERRVLVLRSGLGPRRPRSRARVARVPGRQREAGGPTRAARAATAARARPWRVRRRAEHGRWRRRPSHGRAVAAGDDYHRARVGAALGREDGIGAPGASLTGSRSRASRSPRDRDRGGAEPERAPPAAARPKLPAAIVGGKGGGTDLTVPLLALAALLAIAFAARSAIRSLRS